MRGVLLRTKKQDDTWGCLSDACTAFEAWRS
jgi:hypothetical protein